jgi:hypothetical protein
MSLLPVGIGAGDASYEIEKSLRFRASASAYLSRTPSTAGNRRTWTWSGWVKRGALGTYQYLFATSNVGASAAAYFTFLDDTFSYWDRRQGADNWVLRTSAVFRDPSAWYHIVLTVDTTQAVAANRTKLFINGQEITAFTTASYQNLNEESHLNTTATTCLSAPPNFFDGYLSEINFIDGQALTPTSFGEFDSNGVWVAKKYSGTYGTNGFYLPFNDGTNLTELTKDRSGNANNWTATNVSLTAGATYDWMDDTPTNNFAVLNPLAETLNPATVSSANLNISSTGGTALTMGSSIPMRTGKWYFEFQQTTNDAVNAFPIFGIRRFNATGNAPGGTAFEAGYRTDGQRFYNSAFSSYGASWTTSDLMACAFDLDASSPTVTFYKNNVSQGTITISAIPDGQFLCPAAAFQGTEAACFNFGQRPFAYTPPTGFLPLCTKNTGAIAPISSGSFIGNASTDGPFVWLAGTPNSMTINGNAVTFGTHADRLANGIKLRTSSSSYNASGTNTFTVASFVDNFTDPNRAKGNP